MIDKFNTIQCPQCGELHELKYEWKGTPIIICDKAPPEGPVFFTIGRPLEGDDGWLQPSQPPNPIQQLPLLDDAPQDATDRDNAAEE